MGYLLPPSVWLRPAVTATALVAVALGVAFGIRGGGGTSNFIDIKWEVVACTATGGLVKYPYCNWQEPSDNAGSGSYITKVYYSVGYSSVAIGVDFTIGISETGSGATAFGPSSFTDHQTATGKTISFLTGATLITEGDFLRAITLTDPTSSHTGSMLIEFISRLSNN